MVVISAVTMTKLYLNERQERRRFEDNYEAQVDGMNTWKDKYEREHARVNDIQLSKSEIIHSKDSVIQSIYADLDLTKKRLKHTNSLLKIERITSGEIKIPLRDTIISFQETPTPAMTARYDDGFLSFVAIVFPDSLQASYSYQDELFILQQWERDPDSFFLWRWLGTARKKWYTEVISSNPNTKFTNVKSIIRKKKR